MKTTLALIALASLSGAALAQLSAPSSLPGQNGTVPILQAPSVAVPMQPLRPGLQQQPTPSPADPSGQAHGAPTDTNETRPVEKKLPANLAAQASTGKKLKFRSTPTENTFEASSGAPPRIDVVRVNQSARERFQNLRDDNEGMGQFELNTETSKYDPQQQSATAQTSQRASVGKMVQSKTLMGQPAPPDLNAKSNGRMTAQMNQDVWCERFANHEPRVLRVLVDADKLTPGMSFVLKGVCLGSKPGLIDVRFQGESNKVYRANVQNWEHGKILATLPENIEGVPPTIVEITVTTAGNRVAKPGYFSFEPKWELVTVLHHFSRVVACTGDPRYPYTRSRCTAEKGSFQSQGFKHPDDCRGVCIKWFITFGSENRDPNRNAEVSAIRYTEEDLTIAPERGADRWAFDLPPYAILKSWNIQQESFDNTKSSVRTMWDPATRQIVAHWSMGEIDEQGYLRYSIYGVQAWFPLGMPQKRLPF